MKKFGLIVLGVISSFIFGFPGDLQGQTIGVETGQLSKIEPSTIFEDLKGKKKSSPGITSRQLADYGNQLLTQKGFAYTFDICEFLDRDVELLPFQNNSDNHEPFLKPFSVSFTEIGGARRRFQILANAGDSPCSECFSDIAAIGVTKKEMTVFADGQPVRLRRPKDFLLDEMVLVDKTFKKVIRRWEVPFQTEPAGISENGTKLYLEISMAEEDSEVPPELVLELSEDGTMKIRAAQELNLKKGETLKKFPKDKNNDYLSYKRFRRGVKSYLIRFTEICT